MRALSLPLCPLALVHCPGMCVLELVSGVAFFARAKLSGNEIDAIDCVPL